MTQNNKQITQNEIKVAQNEIKTTRDSFVFYKSFFEALKLIANPKEHLKVFNALCEYALYDKKANIEDFTRQSKATLMLIAPQIKANKVKYTNGLLGGRPKKQ